MKRPLVWLTPALLLLAAGPAVAQEDGARFGIGISLNPTALVIDDFQDLFLPFGFGDIYFPILVSEQLKLEPQAGYFRFSSDTQSDGFSSSADFTVWRLGIGVFYRLPTVESLAAYAGPRFILHRSSESARFEGGSDETSRSDISIGAALGGEYFFSTHFSLGGELQLNYVNVGEPSRDDGPVSFSQDQSVLSNNGLIFLRWYF